MEVDYIVIGAGTAGCVVARELSDRGYSILILEAGTNNSSDEAIQNASTIDSLGLILNAKYLDNIPSVVQKEIGKSLFYSYGRVWGGSSAINAMLYVWGSRGLYKKWESFSDERWSWAHIKESLIQNETYTGGGTNERGHRGPVDVYQNRYRVKNTLSEFFVKAVHKATGVPIVDDYNGSFDECVAYFMQFSYKLDKFGKKRRESSATAYLDEIITQGNEIFPDGFGENIKLISKATVNKVNFDSKRAVSVSYVRNGHSETAFASREIIVCAGAMTPTILQRSGVGDKQCLESLGIKSIVNNPNVGRHLKIHTAISCAVEVETSRIQQMLKLHPEAGIFGQTFLKLGHSQRRLQIIPFVFAEGIIPQEVILLGNWQYDPRKATNLISFFLVDLHPKSSGEVNITHSDTESNPKVNFHAYEEEDDVEFGVQSYLTLYEIIQEMKSSDKDGIYRIIYPPEKCFKRKLAKYVKASSTLFYHYSSQCRMGREKKDSVVDSKLKVFGTEGLRIADLCVCPIIPDGNTGATAFMIGHRASKIILERK
jgi:choline dehydrogenase